MCLTITASLSRYVEKIARNTFAKTKQPLDCALWYIAMRKKNALWGLFKSVQDQRTSTPFILHVEFNHGIVLSASRSWLLHLLILYHITSSSTPAAIKHRQASSIS